MQAAIQLALPTSRSKLDVSDGGCCRPISHSTYRIWGKVGVCGAHPTPRLIDARVTWSELWLAL